MKKTMLVGIVLVVLGVLIIGYDYIPPRRETHSFGIGPIGGVVTTEEETNPTPLILGGILIVAGLFIALRKR